MGYRRDDKDEVIRGYRVDDETICTMCIEEEELEEITKGDLLTEDDLEEEDVLCSVQSTIVSMGRNMGKKYGVILTVIGLIVLCYGEGWGTDWKLYMENDFGGWFYDAESITRSPKDTVRLWGKTVYTDKGVIRRVADIKVISEKYRAIYEKYKDLESKSLASKYKDLESKYKGLSYEQNLIAYSSDSGQSFLLIPDICSGRIRTLQSERSDAGLRIFYRLITHRQVFVFSS